MQDALADYPERVLHDSSRRDLVFVRVSDVVAVHERLQQAVAHIDEWSVVRVGSRLVGRSQEIRPLYRLGGRGPLALPTGRVWARVGPEARVEELAAALEHVGYQVDVTPPWAPNAAWLVHVTRSPVRALADVERLSSVPGIEHVEPEMWMERARR